MTWLRNAVWRRQVVRCFDDQDAGDWPQVTCPGEEMAVHLILQAAPATIANNWACLADQCP